MADIELTCSGCGHRFKISEYVTAREISCPGCSKTVALPVKKATAIPYTMQTPGVKVAEPEEVLADTVVIAANETREKVHKARGEQKKISSVGGWVLFVFFTMVLVGMQRMLAEGAGFLSEYLLGRNIFAGIVYLIFFLYALNDTLFHGLLCLFFPPYSFYYAVGRLDSYWVRGVYFAMLVAFGTELYFIPESSFIESMQRFLNAFISAIEGMIQRAGDAPDF